MKTEKKIPIKSLSYIKQDLQTELEMQRSGLENPLVSETNKKMCSDVSDKVKDVYSNVSDNTCGKYRAFVP